MSFTAFNQSGFNQSVLNTTHLTTLPFASNSSVLHLHNISTTSTASLTPRQADFLSNSTHLINRILINKTAKPSHLPSSTVKLVNLITTKHDANFRTLLTKLAKNIKTTKTTRSTGLTWQNGLVELESVRPDSESPLTTNLIIVFLIFWNIYGFFIQIKLLFFTEIKELSDQVYDNCDKDTSFFKYMIRLKYTDLINGYQLNNGTIMIDLLDTRDQFITRLTIPPDWLIKLNNRKRNKNVSTVKFRLNRKQEFPDIGSIKITHDLYVPEGCAIFVQNIQIKDLTNNRMTIVPINKPIKALGPDVRLLEQMFEANKSFNLEADEDMFEEGITPNVTIFEILMFIFIFINLSVMLTLIMKYTMVDLDALYIHMVICAVPNILSLMVLICLIKLYHHYVKERFILKIGVNNWRLIRLLFIAVSLNCSIIMDLVSFTIINYLKAQLDKWFLICTISLCTVFTLILVAIHSSYHVKINRRLKEGSLGLMHVNESSREKQSLQVPLDMFVLKSPKDGRDQNADNLGVI